MLRHTRNASFLSNGCLRLFAQQHSLTPWFKIAGRTEDDEKFLLQRIEKDPTFMLPERYGAHIYRRTVSKRKARMEPREIPEPRNGMTVETFLRRIGRGCEEHIDAIGSWETLFQSRGLHLKKMGIPVKQRRWILRWTEHYRQGIEPTTTSLLKSKARKNNPGMEKRRRQKYPGWAEYMFPERGDDRVEQQQRTSELVQQREKARKEGLL